MILIRGKDQSLAAVAMSPGRLTVALASIVIGILSPPLIAQPDPEYSLSLKNKLDPQQRQHCAWIDFSPNGKRLAIRHGLRDRRDMIRIWSLSDDALTTWECDRVTAHFGAAQLCHFDAKGEIVYFADGRGVQMRELNRDASVLFGSFPELREAKMSVDHMMLVPNEKQTVIQVLCCQESGAAVLRYSSSDTKRADVALTVKINRALTSASVSKDGSMVCLAYQDESDAEISRLEVWNVSKSERVFQTKTQNGGICACKFTPDSRRIVVGAQDGTVMCIDINTGRRQFSLTEEHSIADFEFLPEKNALVIASRARGEDPNVLFADLATGKVRAKFNADHRGMRCVRVSSDGQKIATAGGEDIVRVWSTAKLFR